MKNKTILLIGTLLLIITILIGCNKPDLGLINAVKTFEASWQIINQKLGFVDRNLVTTEKKYESDAKELGSFVTNTPIDTTANGNSFDVTYKKMVLERNKIRADYQLTKSGFDKEVKKFNEWHTRLMKNKIGKDQANKDYLAFKEEYSRLSTQIDSLSARLTRNINQHNKITRDKAFAIGNYNNFHINIH